MTVGAAVQIMERCSEDPMNARPMWLLTRLEGDQRVYVYDGFWGKELNRMKKAGWKVIPL